ncbi:MAG: hypothetical protein BJ554DRAFT_7347 [Olpidium bornovanus]|uniref:Serine/threonine-protein phosphatase 2A activator n=1 Tax=Olpidium bornovanus TaxID=278681 RepID=A0A8H7ZVZ3_9FUNG|nr:MAG: hypothetical protein BJ554DRAFT_7347 [Olpidium bornovanus]
MSHVTMPQPSSGGRPWGAPPPQSTPLPPVPRFPRRTLPPNEDPERYLAATAWLAGPPGKCISIDDDLPRWLSSEAFARIMGFIQTLNDAVVNVKNSDPVDVSEIVGNLVNMLKVMYSWISDIPPLPDAQRFGNKAYRDWVKRLEENSDRLLREAIPSKYHSAVPELAAYLNSCFGNSTRIDYGSGHELSFVSFLCCLDYLGAFESAPLPLPPPLPQALSETATLPVPPPLTDHRALVTRVVVEYLNVVRQLQTVYMLEPAGSHGVWGLDDHQFLPYLWGSAQVRDHPKFKPRSILQKDTVSHLAGEYLYFGCQVWAFPRAFTDAVRHLRRSELGEGQFRHDEDVRRGSVEEAANSPAPAILPAASIPVGG